MSKKKVAKVESRVVQCCMDGCFNEWLMPIDSEGEEGTYCFECSFSEEIERMVNYLRRNYQTEYKIDASV